jgi:prepilin-type N-terminal cleavage/methylation domain-containing protein
MPKTAPQRVRFARHRGYTLVELVVVMAVAGILAAYIAPRFWNQQTFSDRGYVDELASALRSTQKAAVTSWSTPLIGADGSAIQDSAPASTSASPTGTFQFDTQGRLTSNPGTTITVGTHTITLVPGTGLIQVQ